MKSLRISCQLFLYHTIARELLSICEPVGELAIQREGADKLCCLLLVCWLCACALAHVKDDCLTDCYCSLGVECVLINFISFS